MQALGHHGKGEHSLALVSVGAGHGELHRRRSGRTGGRVKQRQWEQRHHAIPRPQRLRLLHEPVSHLHLLLNTLTHQDQEVWHHLHPHTKVHLASKDLWLVLLVRYVPYLHLGH